MSDKRLDCQGTPQATPTCLCLCAWCVNAVKGCCWVLEPWQCPVDHCSDYCERPEGMTEEPAAPTDAGGQDLIRPFGAPSPEGKARRPR